MSDVSTVKESIFEKFFNAPGEIFRAARKELIKDKLKRKFASAYGDAVDKELTALEKVDLAMKNFECFDVNEVLRNKLEAEKAVKSKEILKSQYQEMFGEELNKKII